MIPIRSHSSQVPFKERFTDPRSRSAAEEPRKTLKVWWDLKYRVHFSTLQAIRCSKKQRIIFVSQLNEFLRSETLLSYNKIQLKMRILQNEAQ